MTTQPRTTPDSRARRCLVTGSVCPEAELIRFAAGPDGQVVADLSAHLPGRGMWVGATADRVAEAVRRNLFSRSYKGRIVPPADLSAQVVTALTRRLADRLGLARRAGQALLGFDGVHGALKAGQVACVIEAVDGAADGRDKILRLNAATIAVPVVGLWSRVDLALALGLDDAVHVALAPGALAQGFLVDVRRLVGFVPLRPVDWLVEKPQPAPTVSE